MKILSVVENPFLNASCALVRKSNSSEKVFNLLFSIAGNTYLKHEFNVAPL